MKFNEAKEIVYGLKPDYDMHDFRIEGLKHKRGPSKWGDPDLEYGPQEDYEISELSDGRKVFWARSQAAMEWAYFMFPEGGPRYGATGFVFEKFEGALRVCAKRDKLMSLEEFEEAMNEKQELERGWV